MPAILMLTKENWPKWLLAEIGIGRNGYWSEMALAEMVMAEMALAKVGLGLNGIGRNGFWPKCGKWHWPKCLLAKLGIGPSGVGWNGIGRNGFGRSGNSPLFRGQPKKKREKKKNRGSFGDRSKFMGSFSESVVKRGSNQSLGQIIKLMGFWVIKSEIGLWVTNQKLGVSEWQKIGVYGWQRINQGVIGWDRA